MSKPKYTDAETKKNGSPIETPYKHGDYRNKIKVSLVEENKEESLNKEENSNE